MFTRTFGFEQEDEELPVNMISFSPGVMDTEMQAVIRSSSKKDFHHIERFRKLNETGSLRSPDFIAGTLLSLLEKGRKTAAFMILKSFCRADIFCSFLYKRLQPAHFIEQPHILTETLLLGYNNDDKKIKMM